MGQSSSSSVQLRMPLLQLPQFCYEPSSYGNMEEFLEIFNEQTAHSDALAGASDFITTSVLWRMTNFRARF